MLEINELDVIDSRKLDYIPNHFAKTRINDSDYFEDQIEDWVRVRLKNRYSIVKSPCIDEKGRLRIAAFIAFEDQKELTYFMLACPHFRRL